MNNDLFAQGCALRQSFLQAQATMRAQRDAIRAFLRTHNIPDDKLVAEESLDAWLFDHLMATWPSPLPATPPVVTTPTTPAPESGAATPKGT